MAPLRLPPAQFNCHLVAGTECDFFPSQLFINTLRLHYLLVTSSRLLASSNLSHGTKAVAPQLIGERQRGVVLSNSPRAFKTRCAALFKGAAAILLLAGSVAGGFTSQRGVTRAVERPSSLSRSSSSATRLSVPEAIAGNKTLSTDLKWTFGGKAQRGWAIYIPLILDALGTGKNIESSDFAEAVARWQTRRGLLPTGVVDAETWSEIVRTFQSGRISVRDTPPNENLVVAPVMDFYDPARPPELRQVERNAYTAYKKLVAEAAKERSLGLRITHAGDLDSAERYLRIISAFRSREHQDRLRQAAPKAGRAGLAVNSPHFTGRALDLYVGGEPVSTADANRLIQTRTPVYRWLVKNARKFGFRPYFYEPWHWEYVGAPR